MVFDKTGYLKLCDFKNIRENLQTNFMDTSGTPGYIAPEIILRQNHGCNSDIFSLGVVAYELMLKKKPYSSLNRRFYIENLKDELVQIKYVDLPDGWTISAADFVNRSLQRRPSSRLGIDGMDEIKSHPWFQGIDWSDLENKDIISPFIPKGRNFKQRTRNNQNNNCLSNFNNIKPYIEFLEFSNKFEGYYFDGKDKINNMYEPKKEEIKCSAILLQDLEQVKEQDVQLLEIQNSKNSNSKSKSKCTNSKEAIELGNENIENFKNLENFENKSNYLLLKNKTTSKDTKI